MALIPRALRPSVLIRRKAMRAGFLGNSGFWKFVGLVVFGRSTIKKIFGKSPEVVDVSRLGSGRFMEITTTKPASRRLRKRQLKAGITSPTLKERRQLARLWAGAQSDRAS